MSSSGGHESSWVPEYGWSTLTGDIWGGLGVWQRKSPTWRVRMESPRMSGLFGVPVLDRRWKTEQRNLMAEYQRIFNLYVKLIFPFYFTYHNQLF